MEGCLQLEGRLNGGVFTTGGQVKWRGIYNWRTGYMEGCLQLEGRLHGGVFTTGGQVKWRGIYNWREG